MVHKSRACRLAAKGAAALLVANLFLPASLYAQVTDALSDFSTDSDEPVHIESDELEVRDRENVAIFIGNVVVVQGETTMRTPRLEVHYVGDGGAQENEEDPDRAVGDRSISRLEAREGVVVETGEQTAKGDWADFEMETQIVTLGGDVVLTQGDNVLRGARLNVNLETGESRLLSGKGGEGGEGGRVQGLFKPGEMGDKQE